MGLSSCFTHTTTIAEFPGHREAQYQYMSDSDEEIKHVKFVSASQGKKAREESPYCGKLNLEKVFFKTN